MQTLTLEAVEFSGNIAPPPRDPSVTPQPKEILHPFSFTFQFGRSYLLDGEAGQGGWALSWILSGAAVPNRGRILLDGIPISSQALRRIGWCVRQDRLVRFGFLQMTVAQQIQHGLRQNAQRCFSLEEDYIQRFHSYMSIYIHPQWIIDEYCEHWFKAVIRILTGCGALVVVPLRAVSNALTLCDEIVRLP